MGPIGSKVIEVKGQIYVFLFVPLLLPGPWADLHQTWWEGGGRPRILARGVHFLKVCVCVCVCVCVSVCVCVCVLFVFIAAIILLLRRDG